jgi:peroxiredoxin
MPMPELLPIGSRAPDFSLPAADGHMIALSHLIARHHVVVVFYVGDNTPD